MEIRPIKTEEDYRAALKEIEKRMDAEPGSDDEAKLEVLTTLVEQYESLHYPIPPPDPIAAIQYFMESRGLTRKDLEPAIGSRGRVAEVLNRKRPLTLSMIRRLNTLGVPAGVLVQDYSLSTKVSRNGEGTEPPHGEL